MPPKFLILITIGDHVETHMPAILQFLPVFLYILCLVHRYLLQNLAVLLKSQDLLISFNHDT